MSVRLKDRTKSIPNGFKFVVPGAPKWKPAPWVSFDMLVKEVIMLLQGNPHLRNGLGWPSLEYDFVADKVDEYNARLCQAHRWFDFIAEQRSTSPPKSLPRPGSPSGVVGAVVVGAKTIAEMFGPEGPIGDKQHATTRASICAACSCNDTEKSWEDYFTVPLSNLIRGALSLLRNRNLKTELDDKLGTCRVCTCPLTLKVWARESHILAHLPASDKEALPPHCWIKLEETKQ